jgi:Flp pilus assembly pilin Flp
MFTYLSFIVARLRSMLLTAASSQSSSAAGLGSSAKRAHTSQGLSSRPTRRTNRSRPGRRRLRTLEYGQASVEYALVLLGAALVATLLITWATSTDLIGGLFDYILGLVKGKAK